MYGQPDRAGSPQLRVGSAPDAGQFLPPPLADLVSQRMTVIVEEEEGPAAAHFLALEEHGCLRRQKPERDKRAVLPGAGQVAKAKAERGVGDLVMVFEVGDEARGRYAERARPAEFLLPLADLSLERESPTSQPR